MRGTFLRPLDVFLWELKNSWGAILGPIWGSKQAFVTELPFYPQIGPKMAPQLSLCPHRNTPRGYVFLRPKSKADIQY